MTDLTNPKGYLSRLAKPLQEKLRVVKYFPAHTNTVVDVGCADGTVTRAMARLFPEIKFFGIDLNHKFIEKAKNMAQRQKLKNVHFERVYLRELLARPEKYDVVSFISVLHEFYTYGEGISSVLKALADAHELINKKGVIIVRDMILSEYTKGADLQKDILVSKIRTNKNVRKQLSDFEKIFGKLDNLQKINHFLLKYMYTDNWKHELPENYVPVTFEQYEQIFKLLGMKMQYKNSYLIPYLKKLWMKDFGLTKDEVNGLVSTGIIVAEKA